jgi:hypothetical protein
MKPAATEALEHASVQQYCQLLRIPVVSANFVPLAEQAVGCAREVRDVHRSDGKEDEEVSEFPFEQRLDRRVHKFRTLPLRDHGIMTMIKGAFWDEEDGSGFL